MGMWNDTGTPFGNLLQTFGLGTHMEQERINQAAALKNQQSVRSNQIMGDLMREALTLQGPGGTPPQMHPSRIINHLLNSDAGKAAMADPNFNFAEASKTILDTVFPQPKVLSEVSPGGALPQQNPDGSITTAYARPPTTVQEMEYRKTLKPAEASLFDKITDPTQSSTEQERAHQALVAQGFDANLLAQIRGGLIEVTPERDANGELTGNVLFSNKYTGQASSAEATPGAGVPWATTPQMPSPAPTGEEGHPFLAPGEGNVPPGPQGAAPAPLEQPQVAMPAEQPPITPQAPTAGKHAINPAGPTTGAQPAIPNLGAQSASRGAAMAGQEAAQMPAAPYFENTPESTAYSGGLYGWVAETVGGIADQVGMPKFTDAEVAAGRRKIRRIGTTIDGIRESAANRGVVNAALQRLQTLGPSLSVLKGPQDALGNMIELWDLADGEIQAEKRRMKEGGLNRHDKQVSREMIADWERLQRALPNKEQMVSLLENIRSGKDRSMTLAKGKRMVVDLFKLVGDAGLGEELKARGPKVTVNEIMSADPEDVRGWVGSMKKQEFEALPEAKKRALFYKLNPRR